MKKIFLLLIISSTLLSSQNEFLVNTYTDSTQRWPSIDKDGSVVDGYFIYAIIVSLIGNLGFLYLLFTKLKKSIRGNTQYKSQKFAPSGFFVFTLS